MTTYHPGAPQGERDKSRPRETAVMTARMISLNNSLGAESVSMSFLFLFPSCVGPDARAKLRQEGVQGEKKRLIVVHTYSGA